MLWVEPQRRFAVEPDREIVARWHQTGAERIAATALPGCAWPVLMICCRSVENE
jgi:hypothetical protein